jgi:hypothetical protein
MLDLLIVREKNGKREIKLLQILIFIKSTVWKVSSSKSKDSIHGKLILSNLISILYV